MSSWLPRRTHASQFLPHPSQHYIYASNSQPDPVLSRHKGYSTALLQCQCQCRVRRAVSASLSVKPDTSRVPCRIPWRKTKKPKDQPPSLPGIRQAARAHSVQNANPLLAHRAMKHAIELLTNGSSGGRYTWLHLHAARHNIMTRDIRAFSVAGSMPRNC